MGGFNTRGRICTEVSAASAGASKAADLVVETVEGAAGLLGYASDYVLGGWGDLLTGGGIAWVPSAARARAAEAALEQGIVAAWEDPGAIVDALTREVVDLWACGNYGAALAVGSVEALGFAIGPKGAGRLSKLSKLTQRELDDLVKKGVISGEEAKTVRRNHGPPKEGDRPGDGAKDGAFVRRLSVKELVDGILKKSRLRANDPEKFEQELRRDLEQIGETPSGRANLETLNGSDDQLVFQRSDRWGVSGDNGAIEVGYAAAGDKQLSAASLAHELQHRADMAAGKLDALLETAATRPGFPNLAEQLAVEAENAVAETLGGRPRLNYDDSPLGW